MISVRFFAMRANSDDWSGGKIDTDLLHLSYPKIAIFLKFLNSLRPMIFLVVKCGGEGMIRRFSVFDLSFEAHHEDRRVMKRIFIALLTTSRHNEHYRACII